MIAIPNIDKPKGCGKCEVWSLCHYPKVDKGYDDKVMPDCPLIEIPTPHGRLIDADKLRAILRRWTEDEWNQKASPVSWAYAYEDLIDLIDDAPTILEAEE